MSTIPLTTGGTSSLIRPRFGPGMLLQHEDLEQIVDYTTGMYRLLLRSLLGPGIVCGLQVSLTTEKDCFLIGAGVALDCEGYVIEVPKEQKIPIEDVNQLPAFGLVYLRRKTKSCATRSVVCSDGEDTALPTREFEGFEIEVVSMEQPTWTAAIEKNKNPFTDNECPEKCCNLPGILLDSFKKENNQVSLKGDGRNLRVKPVAPNGNGGG